MDISYRLNNSEIEKLKKYKNASIILKRGNILKNGKHKLHLTVGMFDKSLEKGELRYVFTDKRRNYYLQKGGSIDNIFKAFVPYLKPIVKKIIPSLSIAASSTLVSHGVNKALNKKKRRGGNIKIDLSPTDIKKINDILGKLSNMKLTNYKSINQQTGKGIFTSLLIPLIGSMIRSLISGKGCRDNFFEELNNLGNYPMSNIKIDEILQHDKNYIGTYSKDNVPILKNNQSTIINQQDSRLKGSHWISYCKRNDKIFYFDSFAIPFISNVIKSKYPNHKFIYNIYRIQSIDSNQCGRFCILFVRGNIKNENDYNNFLSQFEKNNFLNNDI